MKRYIFSLIVIVLFAGCSFKATQKYKYRVDASNSFDSFRDYYLKGQTRLASTALQRAINNAKQGYDIDSLSKIYLGACALHIGVLIDDKCEEYLKIKHLSQNDSLQDYYHLIEGEFSKIKNPPKEYSDFVNAMKKGDYKSAFEAVKSMKDSTSKLIAASLMKEHLTKPQINYIINEAASMGYKKAVKRWYGYLKTKSTQKERDIINKKMELFD
ncbi:MAG: hypothetical protein GXO12_05260 [Epsilonproteobacteria bacterium]|nr:hypothetical protein [Campylobacterota bacterium]